ncbi:MAG: hypothetical protein WC784_00510 [Candidatus Shapirobacteria bacterium]|jgi:hypothetical protein
MKKFMFVVLIFVVAFMLLTACSGEKTATTMPVATQTQIVVIATLPATETPAPTATLAPTEAPTATMAPVAISCDTPSIQALVTLNGKSISATGEFLDTVLGKRMTYTSRSLLVPEKEWNVELTSTELKTVEETWQNISVCIPEGMFGRIFAGGFEQGVNRYETGVLMTLKSGVYEFNLRNGEVVLWYPQQNEFAAKDLVRIVEQIKVGNFDIKSPLAFFGVTTDLLPSIPAELVKERNVQIIPFAEPLAQ